MSILDQQLNSSTAEDQVKRLIGNGQNLFRILLSYYSQNVNIFWKNGEFTPEQIGAAMGDRAAEMFALNGELRTFINTLKPNSTDSIDQTIGDFVINEDNTITITPPVE